MDHEACPICWRPFAATAVPICLACGHSCCSDCLGSIRSCPLCRLKIAPSFPKKPNYSLLAIIDKAAAVALTSISHQTTQTDLISVPPPLASSSRARQPTASFLEGKAFTLAFKKSAIELKFK